MLRYASRPCAFAVLAVLAATACATPRSAPPFRFDQELGVATFKAGDAGCLAITNPSLAPGKRVTLAWVTDGASSSVSEMLVVAKADSACDAKLGIGAEAIPTFYRVQRSGTTPSGEWLAVAVVDPATPITIRAGVPVGDLDGDGALETLNSCTSTEGLHFRVWTGAAYTGRVRWHGYVYLGYDMVGSCKDLDHFVTTDTTRRITTALRRSRH